MKNTLKPEEQTKQRIEYSGMTVNVVSVPGLAGYRFDAVGMKSLPLAVDLAIQQARTFRTGGRVDADKSR